MRISLMIETQEGVGWDAWRDLAGRAEDAGLAGLAVSDHYLSMVDEGREALDAWGVLAGLATVTSRLELGTLVSPATFRHPAVLARLGLTVEAISGGRARVGLGAGWFAREHEAFGFPFGELGERLDELERQAEVVRRLLDAGSPGRHVPLVLGGAARPRMAWLAARVASEYNVVMVEPAFCQEARARLDDACAAAGRDPATLPMTLMARAVLGADAAEVAARVARVVAREGAEPAPEERAAWLVGTPREAAARLAEYRAAGVVDVQLQHYDHADLAMVDLLGELQGLVAG